MAARAEKHGCVVVTGHEASEAAQDGEHRDDNGQHLLQRGQSQRLPNLDALAVLEELVFGIEAETIEVFHPDGTYFVRPPRPMTAHPPVCSASSSVFCSSRTTRLPRSSTTSAKLSRVLFMVRTSSIVSTCSLIGVFAIVRRSEGGAFRPDRTALQRMAAAPPA